MIGPGLVSEKWLVFRATYDNCVLTKFVSVDKKDFIFTKGFNVLFHINNIQAISKDIFCESEVPWNRGEIKVKIRSISKSNEVE